MKDFTKIVFAVAFVFMVVGGAAQANTIGGDVDVDVRTSSVENTARVFQIKKQKLFQHVIHKL